MAMVRTDETPAAVHDDRSREPDWANAGFSSLDRARLDGERIIELCISDPSVVVPSVPAGTWPNCWAT